MTQFPGWSTRQCCRSRRGSSELPECAGQRVISACLFIGSAVRSMPTLMARAGMGTAMATLMVKMANVLARLMMGT